MHLIVRSATKNFYYSISVLFLAHNAADPIWSKQYTLYNKMLVIVVCLSLSSIVIIYVFICVFFLGIIWCPRFSKRTNIMLFDSFTESIWTKMCGHHAQPNTYTRWHKVKRMLKLHMNRFYMIAAAAAAIHTLIEWAKWWNSFVHKQFVVQICKSMNDVIQLLYFHILKSRPAKTFSFAFLSYVAGLMCTPFNSSHSVANQVKLDRVFGLIRNDNFCSNDFNNIKWWKKLLAVHLLLLLLKSVTVQIFQTIVSRYSRKRHTTTILSHIRYKCPRIRIEWNETKEMHARQ